MKLEEFLNKFSSYLSNPKIRKPRIDLKNATVNLNNSKPGDIVFYNRHEGQVNDEVFFERLDKANCSLLITNRAIDINWQGNVVESNNMGELVDLVSGEFYPLDVAKKLIGITGTNGKSTVVHLCRQLCKFKKQRSISIGTLGVVDGDDKCLEVTGNTSPSNLDVKRILFEYREKYDYAFFEVSSHALDQDRFKGLEFEVVAWTNFTQDHLDYHKSLTNYFAAKLKILELIKANKIVTSSNDELIKKLDKERVNLVKPSFKRDYPRLFKAGHNCENLDLALNIMQTLGLEFSSSELLKLSMPDGRFQEFNKDQKKIVVDYAHTPDAIKNILISCREVYPDRKIIIVFGCGGDRDPSKRNLMGKMAESFSDLVIVSSDNPRFEDPGLIVKDIQKGIEKKNTLVIIDRREAIHKAIELLDEKTVAIIAGKGHETYQEIKGIKHSFSDAEIICKKLGIKHV